MEACGSAHYWARELQPLGHTIRLPPPHDVHRYVRRNKTDRTDTRAMLEAHRNADIHPVPVKSVDQQTVTALHRLRATWLATRTARINTLRGLLREFGVLIPVGAHHVGPALRAIGDGPEVPLALHPLLTAGADEIAALETAIGDLDRRLAALARQLPDAALLQTIPGIGVITATALIGQVGCPQRFPSGRHFASYLGLTAREDSSAQRRRLGAISKQGDTYLRMLLTHGARSILCHAKRQAAPDPLRALGAPGGTAARPQRGDRRRRQQAGAHRLGSLDTPRAVHRVAHHDITKELTTTDSLRGTHPGRTGGGTPR